MKRWDRGRAALYEAEQRTWREVGGSEELTGTSLRLSRWEAVDLYTREVQERAWWREAGGPRVQVQPSRGRSGQALGGKWGGGPHRITIPEWGRHKPYVLHELLHHLNARTGHGPAFRGWLLAAYEYELPERYGESLARGLELRGLDVVLPRQHSENLLRLSPAMDTFTA